MSGRIASFEVSSLKVRDASSADRSIEVAGSSSWWIACNPNTLEGRVRCTVIASVVVVVLAIGLFMSLRFHPKIHPGVAVAEALAKELGVKLSTDSSGSPFKIGQGAYGTVWAVEGDLALKVGKMQYHDDADEELVCLSMPKNASLLSCLGSAVVDSMSGTYSGLLMNQLHGFDGTAFYKSEYQSGQNPLPSAEQGLQFAADLAVAVYALHNKIDGFVIMHCDILPKNLFITNHSRLILFDYGLSLVGHRRGEAEFQFQSKSVYSHCRGTAWGASWFEGVVPYTATQEWREVALAVIKLMESKRYPCRWDAGDLEKSLASSRIPQVCENGTSIAQAKCAAERELDEYEHLQGPLKEVVKYFLLNSDQTNLSDDSFVKHEAFNELPEDQRPWNRLEKITKVMPSDEFQKTFAQNVSLSAGSFAVIL
eukprot:TRINITY_DN73133_c0_g1_i1.p1 TRINITY_DN73133_c0_g1~~TRINITY_DN73133_c0_g1_i1.p1  ORF type:complete len:425 (+),score=40.05 TRINITY_DN73133_c0_g1_i1:88-1362(+)